MLRIARLLKKRAKTVIFATTTPVRCDNPHNKNEYIAAYNENIVPRLMEMGVVINDLYTPLSKDIDAYIREDDKIHLSDAGIKLAAEMVENIIRSEAAKLLGNDEKSSGPQEAQRVGAPI
jgi:lysophospholipase L1-like esterase